MNHTRLGIESQPLKGRYENNDSTVICFLPLGSRVVIGQFFFDTARAKS